MMLLVLLVGFAAVCAPPLDLSSRSSDVVAFVTRDLLASRDDRRTLGYAVARLHRRAPSARIGLLLGDPGAEVRWLSPDEASHPETPVQLLVGSGTAAPADARPNLQVGVSKAVSAMSPWGVNRFLLILAGGAVDGGDFEQVRDLARRVHLTVVAAEIGPGPHGDALSRYWTLGALIEHGHVDRAFDYIGSRVERHKEDIGHLLALCAFVVLMAKLLIEQTRDAFEAAEMTAQLRGRLLALKLRPLRGS
jgi:hypothetical protein